MTGYDEHSHGRGLRGIKGAARDTLQAAFDLARSARIIVPGDVIIEQLMAAVEAYTPPQAPAPPTDTLGAAAMQNALRFMVEAQERRNAQVAAAITTVMLHGLASSVRAGLGAQVPPADGRCYAYQLVIHELGDDGAGHRVATTAFIRREVQISGGRLVPQTSPDLPLSVVQMGIVYAHEQVSSLTDPNNTRTTEHKWSDFDSNGPTIQRLAWAADQQVAAALTPGIQTPGTAVATVSGMCLFVPAAS
jgi:hypothetical protein